MPRDTRLLRLPGFTDKRAGAARRTQAVACGACAVALVFPAVLGASQSLALSASWPDATSLVAILRQLPTHGPGRLLVENPAVARYYLPAGTRWRRWSGTRGPRLLLGDRAELHRRPRP